MPARLRVIPLGGLGEVGKNMMALETEEDILVIDAGVLFPSEEMLGVDFVIPDIRYLVERKDRVRAILITHGHEDHTGALPYVLSRLPVPVYAPRLAQGLIEVKLREQHAMRGTHVEVLEPGKELRLGRLGVEFFRVCHSIPDAMGIAVRTPLGLVLHTGDFKIDHTPVDGLPSDFPKLAELSAQGVLLLCSDSTYAELPGFTPSEQVVGEALDRVIAEAPGRVLVATFASLISRVQQVMNAASHHGRRVAVVGRSMVSNVKMALEMGYLHDDGEVLVPIEQVRRLPHSQVVIATTGSQGEPTSALVRMARREHREVHIVRGDTVVFSASPIPGNQTTIGRTIDNLTRQGARVLYERNALVHVHGHASQEELKLVLNLTRPTYLVPVHGEYRHLAAHAALGRSMGMPPSDVFVLEDGDVLEITRDGAGVVDRVPLEDVYVNGRRTWSLGEAALGERQVLSRDGVVLVALPWEQARGRLAGEPRVVARGLPMEANRAELLRSMVTEVQQALKDGVQREELEALAQQALSRYLSHQVGLHPMIVPVVVER